MKRTALLRYLRKHGCHLKREGRSHSLWTNPSTGAIEAIHGSIRPWRIRFRIPAAARDSCQLVFSLRITSRSISGSAHETTKGRKRTFLHLSSVLVASVSTAAAAKADVFSTNRFHSISSRPSSRSHGPASAARRGDDVRTSSS